ncbi:CocE/NonD family hydrolase [Dongia sp.]|uniref:CocE/NonD family hydrolase n=1 Tax=Dongia sp. TaxID=1977262 RepID=UPI0035AFF0E5
MIYRSDFPHKIKVLHHVRIPLKDGVTLSATIWLPEDAEKNPVPAILEYLPYRKRDGTTERDALNHPYFAGHGYAGVRVDIRGSGESEGVLKGEYLKSEQDDCLEILAWLAAQKWCTGDVGMIGISWGGFNGLQVAARRPKELKAVISLCSTDDRYADDIHFMGGCLLVDKLNWGSTMFAYNAAPPDPALVGDKWREMWKQRLEGSGFWLEEWHRTQRRTDLYKHGSIAEDYGAVECPVYLVGGWADGYTNPIFRMLENLSCPRKGLIGPWAHKYPNFAYPGPRIGFLQECLRWWDKWLKGKETGIMDEPMLRVWMQDTVPPQPKYDERPGRWVAEDTWPSARIKPTIYPLAKGALASPGTKPAVEPLTICSPQTVGLAAGAWCPYGLAPDQAIDQRIEAGGSLTFDTEILKEPLEFVGAPVIRLKIAADKPDAFVAVTLSEVLPDGAVTRFSYGLLNLTHRNGHEKLEKLEPGKAYEIAIKLNVCAQKLGVGSRLRVAISSSYWPIVWPSPEKVTLTIFTGESGLELPIRPTRAEDARLPAFAPAENAPPFASRQIRPDNDHARVTLDHHTGTVTVDELDGGGLTSIPEFDNWEYGASTHKTYTIKPADPLSAKADIVWKKEFGRGDFRINIDARTHMSVTREHFRLKATLDAYEGDVRVFSKEWDCLIPRDHV